MHVVYVFLSFLLSFSVSTIIVQSPVVCLCAECCWGLGAITSKPPTSFSSNPLVISFVCVDTIAVSVCTKERSPHEEKKIRKHFLSGTETNLFVSACVCVCVRVCICVC